MRLLATAAVVTAALAGTALAGCGPVHSSSGSSTHSSSLLHSSPLAAVPGTDKAAMKVIVRQCTPASAGGSQQLKWATDILNDNLVHPNGSRQRLWTCVGIPPAKRSAAEGALVTDIEHVHWTSKTSRSAFWDDTMPAWVMQWRSA
jgi:hypothetical protein